MLKFIIRLDDACPYMNKSNWDRMEYLLDKYNIKPIVGIIPECQDKEFLLYSKIENFWSEYALSWQNKDWIIAQHGLNHNLNDIVRTEYQGETFEKQIENLKKGNIILRNNNINPICFFAPAHTFDDNTIKACKELNYFKFISDGVALYPFIYNDMMFLPNIFDTPHKILPFGIYTFVFHPNKMNDDDFLSLERFIIKYIKNFDYDIVKNIDKYKSRKRNLLDFSILFLISLFRKIKKTKR